MRVGLGIVRRVAYLVFLLAIKSDRDSGTKLLYIVELDPLISSDGKVCETLVSGCVWIEGKGKVPFLFCFTQSKSASELESCFSFKVN